MLKLLLIYDKLDWYLLCDPLTCVIRWLGVRTRNPVKRITFCLQDMLQTLFTNKTSSQRALKLRNTTCESCSGETLESAGEAVQVTVLQGQKSLIVMLMRQQFGYCSFLGECHQPQNNSGKVP